MLRKILMLALTATLGKKLYERQKMKQAPFPTARNHPVKKSSAA